jgi:predicted ATPase
MRISSILIENFKAITNIHVSNLPNLVVIVGENGAGKTSIFDAIGFLKSFVGPYNVQDRQWWSQRIRQLPPIRVGSDYMRIEIEIEPTTDAEKKITDNKTAKAGVHVKSDNLEFANVTNQNSANVLLSSWRKISSVGAIEIIPANRTFQEGQVQLQSIQTNEEQILYERTSQLQNKYHNAKNLFVNCFVHDELRPADPPIFPEVKQLVEILLGKKIRINTDENLTVRIEVESSGGFVDVDTLSAGQRELFMTYVGIYTTKLSNSVILFDEPDLHLHASLQKEVLKYLVNMSESGNQIFLATHALEMISETPEKNLFHLAPYTSGSQLHSLTDEKEKVEIFTELGASKYAFVNFKKVVFVEGTSDYSILKHATPSSYGLRFEYTGGISKLAPTLLDKASKIESFFMIRDKDFLDDSVILSEEQKYNNKIKFLKRRHMENYVLDSAELYEVYQKYGDGSISSKQDFVNKLKSISLTQFEQTIADCFLFKYTSNTNPPQVILKTSEKAEDAIVTAFTLKRDRLNSYIQNVANEIQTLRTNLSGKWDNDWLKLCSGKNVLSLLSEKHFTNKSMSDIRDLVSTKWDDKKQLPSELDQILKEIVNL